MISAKEKAKELVLKFPFNGFLLKYGDAPKQYKEHSKQCALIAIDELIIQNGELYLKGIANEYYAEKNAYLFEVKTEIQNL